MIKEIRISGFGGQGVGLAGMILGKAFALYEDLEAAMTQSYGPEARGGASSANVVVSDEKIDYPFVTSPDVLVILSQEAYSKYRSTTKPDAVLIYDEDLVTPNEDDKGYSIPATRIAEGLGSRIVTNVVMLGFLTQVTGLAKRESMEAALETSIREKFIPLNKSAFQAGYEFQEGKVMEAAEGRA